MSRYLLKLSMTRYILQILFKYIYQIWVSWIVDKEGEKFILTKTGSPNATLLISKRKSKHSKPPTISRKIQILEDLAQRLISFYHCLISIFSVRLLFDTNRSKEMTYDRRWTSLPVFDWLFLLEFGGSSWFSAILFEVAI